jgi:hypothetical protein
MPAMCWSPRSYDHRGGRPERNSAFATTDIFPTSYTTCCRPQRSCLGERTCPVDFGKLKWPRFGILKWPRCLGCGVGRHLDLAHSPVAAKCGTLIWPHLVWVFLLAA